MISIYFYIDGFPTNNTCDFVKYKKIIFRIIHINKNIIV